MKIAAFLPNWVGDAVMATPALRAIRQHYPCAQIVGVLKPYVAGVLEGTGLVDRLVFLDIHGKWSSLWPSVAWSLSKERIDLAILFPNSFHSALVAWLARCRRRIGYARNGRSFLLTDRLEPVRSPTRRLVPSPVIDAYNQLAERIDCPKPTYRMELAVTEQDEQKAASVWAKAGFATDDEVVCLNPGAAFGSAKHWPAMAFAQLTKELVARRKCRVLILCGPREREIAQEIVDLAGCPGAFSLADEELSLGLTKACIRGAALLVTTDSGPRHFAAAFDRPVVTLFGPTHIAWTETYYPRAIHLQKQVPCGPCQLRVCPLDHRCMKELSAAEVFQAADELLTRFSRAGTPRRQRAG
jgi:heptosyltransferase-2